MHIKSQLFSTGDLSRTMISFVFSQTVQHEE